MPTTASTVGYLRDSVTRERISFQFNPTDMPIEASATFAKHSPRGSSNPRHHYTSTAGRKGQISLYFVRREPGAADIEVMRRKLESLPFPDYDASGRLRRGPHPLLLVFGAMRTMRIIPQSVKLTLGPFFLPETTAPCELRAEIEYEDSPAQGDLSRDDVAGGL